MKKILYLLLLVPLGLFAQPNTVDVGSAANDGTGDPLRTAMQKLNANDVAAFDSITEIRATANAAISGNSTPDSTFIEATIGTINRYDGEAAINFNSNVLLPGGDSVRFGDETNYFTISSGYGWFGSLHNYFSFVGSDVFVGGSYLYGNAGSFDIGRWEEQCDSIYTEVMAFKSSTASEYAFIQNTAGELTFFDDNFTLGTTLKDFSDSLAVHLDSLQAIRDSINNVVSVDNLSRVIVDTLFIGSMSVYIYNLNDSMMFVDDHYGPFSLGMMYNSSTPSSPSTGAESRWFLENDGTDEEGNHALSANGGATYGTDGTPPQGTYYGNVNASGRYFSYDSISYGDHFTICMEIYPTGDYLTAWSMYKNTDGIEIQVDQTNDDIYVITADGVNTSTATALDCGVASLEWQSLIVTVNRAGGVCEIWLDGVDVTTDGGIEDDFDNSSPARFGRSRDDARQFFAYIDALQLYFWEITEANIGTINTTPGTEVTQ